MEKVALSNRYEVMRCILTFVVIIVMYSLIRLRLYLLVWRKLCQFIRNSPIVKLMIPFMVLSLIIASSLLFGQSTMHDLSKWSALFRQIATLLTPMRLMENFSSDLAIHSYMYNHQKQEQIQYNKGERNQKDRKDLSYLNDEFFTNDIYYDIDDNDNFDLSDNEKVNNLYYGDEEGNLNYNVENKCEASSKGLVNPYKPDSHESMDTCFDPAADGFKVHKTPELKLAKPDTSIKIYRIGKRNLERSLGKMSGNNTLNSIFQIYSNTSDDLLTTAD